MKKFVRYIMSLLAYCRADKKMVTNVAFSLMKATFLVLFVPLKHYHSRFNNATTISSTELQPFTKDFRYFSKAFRLVPWKITCLTRNLAYQIYFEKKRLQFPIYLGLRKDDKNNLMAHAWNVIDQNNNIEYTRIRIHE